MCSNQKFFKCNHCGNIVGLILNKGVPLICCGEKMQELVANSTEAATEKHLPVVTYANEVLHVEVGSVLHPATEEHHIEFIYVETKKGGQRKCIKVADMPKACFSFADDEPVSVFAFCNLHGLWKTEIK